jgi:hypothetical protein
MPRQIQKNTGHFVFTSLTALRALSGENLSEGDLVFLSLSSNPSTGSTRYMWDASSTATDDSDLTIKLTDTTTGRLIRCEGTYNQGGTGAVDRTQKAKNQDVVSVKDFGATGDGVTDDTDEIQAALDSGSGEIVFPQGTYLFSKVRIPNGVKKITSMGATLKCSSYSGEAMFELDGLFFTTTPTSYIEISGFQVNLNFNHRRFVFAAGGNSYCRIHSNTIYSFKTDSGSGMEGIRFYHNTSYNEIYSNVVILPIDEPFGTYPTAFGIYLTGSANSVYGGLDTGVFINPSLVPNRNKIHDNSVVNGTHGIGLFACSYNLIKDNHMEGQSHRSIILGPQASYNSISGNHCLGFGSAGVHLNLQSNENLIEGNYFRSTSTYTGLGGENCIGIHVSCNNNVVKGNYTRGNGVLNYGIFVGAGASNNIITENHIDGANIALAAIALENEYVDSLPSGADYSRTNWELPPDDGVEWAISDTLYNSITNNVIVNPASDVAAISLAQLRPIVIANVTAWGTATEYSVGQVRSESGVAYRALTKHTSGTFATDLADGDWAVLIQPWLTSTSYSIDDNVEEAGLQYRCVVAHTSGVFATDLAAVKWVLVVKKLRYNTIQGNKVVGTAPAHYLHVFEDVSGYCANNTLKDNSWNSTVYTKISMTRGRAHFDIVDGNVPINKQYAANPFMNATNADTTPDVSACDYLSFAATSTTTSVTNFDGGHDGQELTIRLDTDVTIVYNSSLIRLKGNVNVTGDSNSILKLKRFSGIWFETGRNF